jgi:Flp pilus assembly protein TadD
MKHIYLFLIIFLGVIAIGRAQAPNSAFENVDALVQAGELTELSAVYSRILETYPTDRRALLGSAAVLSWQGARDQARATFNQVLALYPNDIDALTGLGYDYAWDGNYQDAEAAFLKALELDPENLSARKGLGFTYLWSGDADKAETLFRAVADDHPRDAEARRGVGQALLAQRRNRSAEAAFAEALQIDPNDAAAIDGAAAARASSGPFEASLWFGNSAAGGDVDVRAVQLTSWVTAKTSLRFRLDDSLSLDNPALARSGIDAQATFLSATHEFNPRFISTLEIGQRDLPGAFEQDIYKFEAALPNGRHTWKFGYQLSPHSAGFDDSLMFGGVSVPLAQRLSLDATLFLAETGATGDDESRVALYLEHRGRHGWTLGGGFGFGSVTSENVATDGTVATANLFASYPVSRLVSTQFQVRWENAPLDDFTVASIGLTVRPGRR